MGKNIKQYWHNGPHWAKVLFWVFMIIGTGLIIASFIIPPVGLIDPSVLKAFGEIQVFASLGMVFECVLRGMDVQIEKGDTKIQINNPDGE